MKSMTKEFQFPFGGKDLFLLAQVNETGQKYIYPLTEEFELSYTPVGKLIQDPTLHNTLREVDVMVPCHITYLIPASKPKEEAKMFKDINTSVYAQLASQITSSTYEISHSHLIPSTDDNTTFTQLLSSNIIPTPGEIPSLPLKIYTRKAVRVSNKDCKGAKHVMKFEG